ncbi:MAG: cysteine desulfurase [Anaerolineaceae bacterium]|nr:cysteine desulfurase [Anaerolineaceae bacterium]
MSYFDYCATTPVHPDVKKAILSTLEMDFGNPSSMHDLGRKAKQLVNISRKYVAEGIKANPEEIIFTSGATEATNLAIIGVMSALPTSKNHIITSQIEHHATLHTVEYLEKKGFEITSLPVSPQGLIDIQDLKEALRSETRLISIMMVNNEMGSVQPIQAIGKIAKEAGIIFHTDAVQGIGCCEIDVDALKVDLLSLSAHKIYGPKGIGALYIRDGILLNPILHGGSQEFKIRAGTENVPGIVGLGEAMNLVSEMKSSQKIKLLDLRNYFIKQLRSIVDNVIINGPEISAAPHIISVSFPNIDGEMLIFNLNRYGFQASLGSACNAESIEPSHVLLAMGLPLEQIDGTIRFSLGYPTTKTEIDKLINKLPDLLDASSF